MHSIISMTQYMSTSPGRCLDSIVTPSGQSPNVIWTPVWSQCQVFEPLSSVYTWSGRQSTLCPNTTWNSVLTQLGLGLDSSQDFD